MVCIKRFTPLLLFAIVTLASDIKVSPQEEQAVRKLIRTIRMRSTAVISARSLLYSRQTGIIKLHRERSRMAAARFKATRQKRTQASCDLRGHHSTSNAFDF